MFESVKSLMIFSPDPLVLRRYRENIYIDPADNGCWIWRKSCRQGYGSMRIDGTLYQVHTAVFFWFYGLPPRGTVIGMACKNKKCSNPAHLFAATRWHHTLRTNSIFARYAKATACLKGHPLSGDNLTLRRNYRECKICKTLRNRRNRAKRKAKEKIEAQRRVTDLAHRVRFYGDGCAN